MIRASIIALGLTFLPSSGASASSEAPTYLHAPPPTTEAKPEYPKQSLRLDEQGVVVASFWIETSGRTSRCAVVTSSGYPRLDRASCAAISNMIFASYQKETLGPFLKRIRWRFEEPSDDNPNLVAIPNPTRGVNRTLPGELPPGGRSNVGLYLTVSADGAVTQCKVRWGSESPDLDRKACEIASNWRYQAFSESNAPRSKLQTVFFADPAASMLEDEESPR